MGSAALAVDPLGDGCMESRWNVVSGMGTAHMRDREDITATVQAYADTVLHACAVFLREQADREDAFQETFLRYARYKGSFNDEEHRKAWLIRVASNICKDMLKSAGAHVVSLDAVEADGAWQPVAGDDGQEGQRRLEGEEFLAALRTLDEKYRSVLYLKYYEGYTAAQIGEMLGIPENTVYTDLARGRQRLKEALGYV